MKKIYTGLMLLLLSTVVLILAGCTGTSGPGIIEFDPEDFYAGTGGQSIELGWTGLDRNFEAELTLGFWGMGPHTLFRDVGRVDHDPADMARNTSAAMAVARMFNHVFPYVTVNAWNGIWGIDTRHSFYLEHGQRVDAFMTPNLVADIVGGHIADLTLFADDPALDLINPTVMQMMSHHGRLWAIPTLLLPHGMFINRELAENQNLDVPPEDWTMDEFIDFVANSRADEFYGIAGIPWPIMNTMTQDIHYQLLFRNPGEPFVRMDTPAVREVLRIAPRVMHHSVNTNRSQGNLSQAFRDQFNDSNWDMFARGALLVFYAQPYRMAYAGSPVHTSRVQVNDWDLYPRPATEWVGNHVGTVIDPFPIRNFAMDDGDPFLSMDEYNMLRMAWEMVRFYALDLRSWQARSDMLWGPQQASAKLESFPFTVGQLYYDMMDVYFQAEERQIFADSRRFPGFHYIMQLWEQGHFWGLWGNAFPFTMNWEGGTRAIMHEWNYRHSATWVGVGETDPSWYDQVLAHLPGWDRDFNDRFQERFDDIYEAMLRFYFPQRRLSQ